MSALPVTDPLDLCPVCRDPMPGPTCASWRQHGSVWACRRAGLGIGIGDLAQRLGVDEGVLARAEQGQATAADVRQLTGWPEALRSALRTHVAAELSRGVPWSRQRVPPGWSVEDVREVARG
jgi:hypothetical protein